MSGGGGGERAKLEFSPTWIVAVVCSVIVLISLLAERFLHYLGKLLKRKNQKPLFEALLKVKEELMLLGFISLLLVGFQGAIQKIRIPESWERHMTPCKRGDESSYAVTKHYASVFFSPVLLAVAGGCFLVVERGRIIVKGREKFHFYLLNALTMLFCGAKMRQWKSWEDAIQKDLAKSDPNKISYLNQCEFIKHRFHGIENKSLIISWLILLVFGTKLEHIISQLAHEIAEKHSAVEGDVAVKPSDDHCWFHRPRLVLFLIPFILFQNAFEIAFFFWILTVYSFDSCIMGQVGFIVPRLVISVIIQFLCSFSTLPLYAIVAQMGTSFKDVIFEEHVRETLVEWANNVKYGKVKGEAITEESKSKAIELRSVSLPNALCREHKESLMEEGEAGGIQVIDQS